MTLPATGHEGATLRIGGLFNTKPFSDRLSALAANAPGVTRKAIGKTASWWHGQAVRHAPVRASVKRSRRKTKRRRARSRPKGYLRQSMQSWTKSTGDRMEGGVRANAHYALWLAAGTRRIAKGRVMKWKPGDMLIRSWPAKRQGGNPRGALPILLPWFEESRSQLANRLKRNLLEKA